jgi:hypothetical protein
MPVNPMDYSGKDTVLDVVRTERANFYRIIDEPKDWESPTRSGHWQVRDLVGHMIDVTEGYLTRWDMARRGEEVTALGLPVMAQELDRVALTFRTLPREEAISRLKTASDKLMAIFDKLTPDEWSGFNVTHVFIGPLPTFFYPAFQVPSRSWIMACTLGTCARDWARRTPRWPSARPACSYPTCSCSCNTPLTSNPRRA